jgi:hypothetical protein
MPEKQNGWDADFLRDLHKLSLEEAIRRATDLVENGTTKPSKKAHLIRDFNKAKNSAEVSRIMYNAMLAGSGLGIQGSQWQKMHGPSP